MDPTLGLVAFAGAAFLLNFLQRVFGGGWNLKGNLADVETRLTAAIIASKKEIEEEQGTVTHNFGETVAAIREHVRQVEFHLRDNYIRKDDFIVHMKSHDDLLRLNFANIDARLGRIEKTLDEKK